MKCSYFTIQELDGSGAEIGAPTRVDYFDMMRAIWLRCPRMLARDLKHFIALACTHPGSDVDFNHWEGDDVRVPRRMTWCARVVYHVNACGD